jgi:hypothetical protein
LSSRTTNQAFNALPVFVGRPALCFRDLGEPVTTLESRVLSLCDHVEVLQKPRVVAVLNGSGGDIDNERRRTFSTKLCTGKRYSNALMGFLN